MRSEFWIESIPCPSLDDSVEVERRTSDREVAIAGVRRFIGMFRKAEKCSQKMVMETPVPQQSWRPVV
jgi:hypothetical protein